MHKAWLLSLAGALLLALAPRPASALPDEHLLSAFGTGPNVPPAGPPSAAVAVAAVSVVDTEDTAAWLAGIAVGMPIAVGGRWRFVAIVAMAIAMAGERSPLELLRIMEAGVTMARIPTMEAPVRNTILMAGGHIEALTTEVLGSIGAVATTEALGCPITGAVTEALGFPTIGVVSEAAGVGAETASDPNFETRDHEACASRLKRSTLLGKDGRASFLIDTARPVRDQLASVTVKREHRQRRFSA